MRLWERICEDLQDFEQRISEVIIHETLGLDSLGFMRLWERIS